MSENIYKFENSPESTTQQDNQPSGNINNPLNNIKDIGAIPLPKDKDLNKWFVVIAVIIMILALWFVGSWINKEMEFKNSQIKQCNENFQTLNVKYVLKDQELQQIKNKEEVTNSSTSTDRKETNTETQP